MKKLLVFATLAAMSANVFAYTLADNSPYPDNQYGLSVRVFSSGLGIDTTVPNADGTMSYDEVVFRALDHLNRWNNLQLSGTTQAKRIVTTTETAANMDGVNDIFFCSDLDTIGPNVTGVCYSTGVQPINGNWVVTENNILIRHFGAGNDFSWSSSTKDAAGIFQTILHELGHALGLFHSDATKAIMRPVVGSTSILTTDDCAGLAVVHGAKEGTPAPSPTPYPSSSPPPTPTPIPTPSPNQVPVVTIIKPETDSTTTKKAKISVTVVAMDDQEVDLVQYRTSFRPTWKSLKFQRRAGTYSVKVPLPRAAKTSIEVRAIDNAGLVSDSEAITVTRQ